MKPDSPLDRAVLQLHGNRLDGNSSRFALVEHTLRNDRKKLHVIYTFSHDCTNNRIYEMISRISIEMQRTPPFLALLRPASDYDFSVATVNFEKRTIAYKTHRQLCRKLMQYCLRVFIVGNICLKHTAY